MHCCKAKSTSVRCRVLTTREEEYQEALRIHKNSKPKIKKMARICEEHGTLVHTSMVVDKASWDTEGSASSVLRCKSILQLGMRSWLRMLHRWIGSQSTNQCVVSWVGFIDITI